MNISVSALWVVAAVAAILVSANVSAAGDSDEAYRCNIGKAFRVFSLDYPGAGSGGGCQVLYEKSNATEPVRAIWRAKYDLQFCTDRMRSSVNKLVEAGWDCEMTSIKLTSPAPVQPGLTDKQPPQQVSRSQPAASDAEPAEPAGPEYDDWFHRWDEAGRHLVFTLYNKNDGTKARSFAWAHKALSRDAASPSNIVFIQNQKSKPILIVAWPGKKSQFITAIDPLRQDSPFCEIETETTDDSGWGFGMDNGAIVLTGQKIPPGEPGRYEPFRQECQIAR